MSNYYLFSLPKSFRKHLREVSGLEELTFTPNQIRNGTFIKLTIKSEGFTMTAYQTEGIDNDGIEIRLSFYNLPTTGTAGTMQSRGLGGTGADIVSESVLLGKTVFQPGTVIYIVILREESASERWLNK